MQIKNQQLELDMEQHIGSKLGKENIKAVYFNKGLIKKKKKKKNIFLNILNKKENKATA